jgi:hypothetical protein
MRQVQKLNRPSCNRQTERGMALVSVLLISTLLLTAGGLLLLTTSMSTTNSADSAAEMQAYYTAEAGLQRTLNVLRSRDIPAGTMPAGKTKISIRHVALNPTLANWIPFDGPTIDGAQTTLVGTNVFSVLIIDPDDQGPVATRKINTISTYQPSRVNIQVTGYGPRRAKKVLNMMVLRWDLSGFQAPATITLRGSDALPTPPPLTLDTGMSGSVKYTGNDAAGGTSIPAFAVTASDYNPTDTGIKRDDSIQGTPIGVLGTTSPIPTAPPAPMPQWLDTADAARAFMANLKEVASGQNRHFTVKPATSEMGVLGAPKLTFVEGAVNLGSGDQGTGLLVVTGKLTMTGNTSFRGVILVLGEGVVERSGGGDGVISGGIVVAKFGTTGGFGSPVFTSDGGGTSRIQYNSTDVSEALSTTPEFQVLGVVEQ